MTPVKLEYRQRVTTAEQLLLHGWDNVGGEKLVQSTFSSRKSLDLETATVIADRSGFINSAVEAYNYHHDLVIRPDDVWIAILTQISF